MRFTAVHEFGILKRPSETGERFDVYEPEKYECIACDEAYIEGVIKRLKSLNAFSHSLDNPCRGLEYTGITLIPPSSLKELTEAFKDIPEADELCGKMKNAERDGKWMIHFGL